MPELGHLFLGTNNFVVHRVISFVKYCSWAMETWMSGCIQLLKHKRIHTVPSNVLLDNDLTMHVSDFGLARFVLKPTDNAPTNHQTSSIGIRGSVGYAAPEYGMGSEVSTYGDVYNFGILLLEMFTGKRLTDNMFSDGFNLHNFVKTVYLERATAIADLLLLQGGAKDTPNDQCSSRAQKLEECLSLTFGIGIACSAESPTDRKDISGVASELRSIRNNLPA